MKHFLVVLAAACALLLALAGPAMAGGGLLGGGGGSQDQSVTNSTDQSNQAGAVNVPILSGNNVSVASSGDQSNSAGVEQNQANVNGTSQQASQSQGSDPSQAQSTSNSTDQSNQAGAVNVPILSGNNVSVLSSGDQSNSAGVEQDQVNANSTDQKAAQNSGSSDGPSKCKHDAAKSGSDQTQKVENPTEQENEARAVNVPIASGNNVSVLSSGNQSNSAGVEQNQVNANSTDQQATQNSESSDEHSTCKCESKKPGGDPKQTVSNRTEQENEARAVNVPIASGNNVSVLSSGNQSNSAGVEQNQANLNVTKQEASQTSSTEHSKSEDSSKCRHDCKQSGNDQTQKVENRTEQENEAQAFNAPVLSGNNVALLGTSCKKGSTQTNSAGVEQNQLNLNSTRQTARQS